MCELCEPYTEFPVLVLYHPTFILLQLGALGFPGFGLTKCLLQDLRFAAGVVGVLAMGIVVGYLEATLEIYLGQVITTLETSNAATSSSSLTC